MNKLKISIFSLFYFSFFFIYIYLQDALRLKETYVVHPGRGDPGGIRQLRERTYGRFNSWWPPSSWRFIWLISSRHRWYRTYPGTVRNSTVTDSLSSIFSDKIIVSYERKCMRLSFCLLIWSSQAITWLALVIFTQKLPTKVWIEFLLYL